MTQETRVMTDAELDAIQARADASTPGPWVRDPWSSPDLQVIAYGHEVVRHHRRHYRQVNTRVVPNHEFIAHAREDVPVLVSEVRRLRAGNERLTRERDESRAELAEHRAELGRVAVTLTRAREVNAELVALLRQIAFEPFGPAEASHEHVLTAITDLARAALAKAEATK